MVYRPKWRSGPHHWIDGRDNIVSCYYSLGGFGRLSFVEHLRVLSFKTLVIDDSAEVNWLYLQALEGVPVAIPSEGERLSMNIVIIREAPEFNYWTVDHGIVKRSPS